MANLLVSFSTASLPSILAMKKQTAAPAIALDQERIAPCHQPKMAALAKVIKMPEEERPQIEKPLTRRKPA